MAALQWRSSTGRPVLTVRHCQPGRLASRSAVKVHASFVNPHQILGVCESADVKEVKRAYRKLALQYHPDVCKTQDGHDRFLALTQAYEMLLGRAEGKTDPGHASASGWDFHDWYWSFRMQRSWEKQQQQHGGSADSGAARRASAAAGYKQPEARDNLRSQLAGLRHRAAVRAHRPAPSTASACGAASGSAGCASDDEPQTQTAHADSSGCADSAAMPGSHTSCTASAPEARWHLSWFEATEDDEPPRDDEGGEGPAVGAAATEAPSSGSYEDSGAPAAADADLLHHQFTHVYDATGGSGRGMDLHDGHYATMAFNHAVPFPGVAASASATATKDNGAEVEAFRDTQPADAEPEPFSNPNEKAHRQRRRFVAHDGVREAVSGQLAGLRRKASLKGSV